jgi:hypothetical protein
MKKIFYIQVSIILQLACIIPSFAQLNISSGLTTQQVQNIFFNGNITVSNLSITGLPVMTGTFTNGNTTNLGLDAGIILCTGNASDIAQVGSMTMSTDQGQAGDGNLNAISSAATYDACVLEFDFIPFSDSIQFRYVFGSEEYPEYVNSTYNDIFAFFITGPNPAGGNYTSQNMAIIPDTTLPVSINNVNNVTPSYPQYYVDNTSGPTIVYDGFTTPLTAFALVVPCTSYHMKLVVADVGDGILDSGVFLEEHSLTSGGFSVTPSYSNTALGNNAVEGYSSGIFSFTTPSPVTTPLTINYTIGGTATNGTDYAFIGNSVTIPTGSDSAAVVINPFMDGLVEGTETVSLSIPTTCSMAVFTLNIVDIVSLQAIATGAMTICTGDSATLSVTAIGGIPPYSYNWSNSGGTGDSATFSPAITTTYTVTVTDDSGQSATDSQVITVANYLVVSVTPSVATYCSGNPVSLTASGATNYTWSPGTGLSSTSGAIVYASPATTTTYVVTGSSNSGCTGSTSVTVNVMTLSLTVTSTNEACGQSDGTATVTPAGSCSSGYAYVWSTTPPQTTSVATGLSEGTYTVTVFCGSCSATATVNVSSSSCGPEICMVTTDTASNINIVIWEKPVTTTISEYYIYRESSVSGIYNLIGTQNYSDYSVYYDSTSNSLQQPYRYKLASLDTGSIISAQSDYHQSIHLAVYPGTSGSWNLIWNNYEGFTFSTYNIYRGTSSSNLSLLNSVASSVTSYTDVTPPAGNMYYLIEAMRPTPCNPAFKEGENVTSTVSNIANTSGIGFSEFSGDENIQIYPNPAQDEISVSSTFITNSKLEILNSLGQIIYSGNLSTNTKTIDVSSFSEGVYFLVLKGNTFSIYKKIILQ